MTFCLGVYACMCMCVLMNVSVPVRMCVCVFGRVLGACMLGGVGIRNRLRGNWTAGRQEGGRVEEGMRRGREGGMMERLVSSGSLWHDYSVPPEQAGHQLVCRGLERGKK